MLFVGGAARPGALHCREASGWIHSRDMQSNLDGRALREAEEHVKALRDVELDKVRWQNRSIAEWMEKAVRKTNLGAAPPVVYIASRNWLLHLDTEGGVTLCQHRQVAGARGFGQVRSLCVAERAVQRLFQFGRSPMAVSMIG